jgi:hypothetical protein
VLQTISTNPSVVLATTLNNKHVGLASARRGDWIATRVEPSARGGAGCRISAGQAAEGSGCNKTTSGATPGGPPTRYVEPVPSVAAEAQAEAAIVACQTQQRSHQQQLQQSDQQPPVKVRVIRLLGLIGGL